MEQANTNKERTGIRINPHLQTVSSLQKRIHHIITSSSLLQENETVIIGVSGGSDSICLLHLLSLLFPASRRIAVYVDHGLRPQEIDAEKILVQKQAESCSAHFETVSIDVQKEKKLKKCSLEEACRNLRYQALEDFRVQYQAAAIAVAHTADDQAEEILLRLIRGSGSCGLSGMKLRHGNIIRPLLQEKKETLLSWLKERNIPFCLDSSNNDRKFLRNRIRLDLLPKLEHEYNQSMRQTLLQTAEILNEEDSFLNELVKKCFPGLVHKEKEKLILELSNFDRESLAIKRRVLEKICWDLQSRPSFKKIQSLLALASSGSAKEIHLTGGLRAVRQSNTILFHRPSWKKSYRGSGVIPKTFSPITISGPGTYPVAELNHRLEITEARFSPDFPLDSEHQLIDMENIRFPLILRHHRPGECFHPLGAPGKKKIARFFSDRKIPLSARDMFPILLSEKNILAIIGLRIDQHFRVNETTKHVLMVKWKNNA